ncbi:MAG: hypothetical protein VZR64_00295 [Eubacterium sp.]|nr:hypothetical protein [Eubacterium sp.]
MKKNDKVKATWLSLMSIMTQSVFAAKTIALLDHNYNAIARITGMPSDDELEATVDEHGISDFNLCEWLLDGHIDTATNECELADIFARTRHIVANDIDDYTQWWRHDVRGFRCGDLYIEGVKSSADEPGKLIVTDKRRICMQV